MKKTLIALLMLSAFNVRAQQQQNVFLSQAYWPNASIETVKADIEKGNNPSKPNGSAFDATVYSILGQAPVVTTKYLMELPGNEVNKITHDGRTYLHWAAYKGNTEIMEYLLAKGAKTDILDTRGASPLIFAVSAGMQNTKVYDLLIKAGVDIKKEKSSEGANALLLGIATDKDFSLTNYFVSKGLDIKSVDNAGNNAFSYAARSGNIEQIKAVQAKGVPVNQTALLMVAQSGGGRRGEPAPVANADPLAIYKFLESVGVKATATSKTGQNVLHYLVRRPNASRLVKYFLDKGADVNKADDEGNTPLMYAVAVNRDLELLNLLLPNVTNINQANKNGETALTLAMRNTPAIISYLISKGADAKVLDKKGNNLVYYAVEAYRSGGGERGPEGPKAEDFDAKLKILQDNGVNVAAPQQNGNTLYHLAVAKNDLSLVKRIQPLGIDVNAKNKEGITALHKAAMISKDDALLKYLLSIGAKKDIVTNFNETAFALATENESFTKGNVSVTFLK